MSVNNLKILIDEQQWDRAIQMIHSDPSILKKRYALPTFVNEWKDASDVYPIHHACSMMNVPLELIDVMLSSFPKSIEKNESSLQRSCLHIAILKCLPDHILSRLIDVFPDAVKAQDKFGRVPLHYALSSLRNFQIVEKIITVFPSCIQAQDWKGWTPFHVAVTKNTNPNIISFMLSQCPQAVSIKNKNGSNALKLISEANDFANKAAIMEIVFKKDAELDELPESQNLRNATAGRPQTPLNMKPYCLV